ncbi:rRNA-processing protein bfr2 [Friedmanniomyces endolithicus]|uniref:Protein BFR2 n=1 Tax=Friedmanniomyces endolithicus TaxID=329885 RepID=A0AAN6L3H4_9PEZI|nr:rRNA-processing protein bfr2 [Friedmanniomyces endolithicus]KAK0298290.1 rRNA-processing protein bfr2 [Friedmanniomyces endolithicus]KAK0323829.1 rRNA-processing protein bfr2 [Friedmanniomyces endolithicus]KAK0830503.1 rRNA-processing protein bfr2 [Friedmanniomyces endolithicus]KAK0931430.1 rRNA-processing protein bfr2 [Friedmanniomyces endolithicus]
MAPNKGRNRAAEFDHLIDSGQADIDPEAEDGPDVDSDSRDESASEDDGAAREHYADVGKSTLHKPREVTLGPRYSGSRVGRHAAMDDEDGDDPFSKGFEDGDSEEGEPELESTDGSLAEDNNEDTPETDVSDEDDELSRPNAASFQASQRDEVKMAMRDAPKVAVALAKANQADVEKGRAVKQQRKAFDILLSTRMKLQKALIGVNTVASIPDADLSTQRQDAAEAIEAAETAAFTLWSSLSNFRDELDAARTGEKRKRTAFIPETTTSDLWSHLQDQEADSVERRNAILQKWSKKTQEGRDVVQRSRLNNSAPQTTVVDVIQQNLADTSRLLKRAYTPRSCAPVQLANKVAEDESIYDDADFYGLLLKELLESKSADSVTTSNIDLSFQMRREAKTKKHVDTKASKGRKMRYTVHEKLQNFMAPEDRRIWGERQADELFGSLFGQRLGLSEGKEVEDEDVDMGGKKDAEEALMLFRR